MCVCPIYLFGVERITKGLRMFTYERLAGLAILDKENDSHSAPDKTSCIRNSVGTLRLGLTVVF